MGEQAIGRTNGALHSGTRSRWPLCTAAKWVCSRPARCRVCGVAVWQKRGDVWQARLVWEGGLVALVQHLRLQGLGLGGLVDLVVDSHGGGLTAKSFGRHVVCVVDGRDLGHVGLVR